eukprot:639269-Alexandrium_andersonii.AAC.1
MHVRHCDYLAVHFSEVRQSVSPASLRSPHGSLFHPSRCANPRWPPAARSQNETCCAGPPAMSCRLAQ